MEDEKYFQKIQINNNVLSELGEYDIPYTLLSLMNELMKNYNINIDKEKYIGEYLNDKYLSDEKERIKTYKQTEKQIRIELKRKERKNNRCDE